MRNLKQLGRAAALALAISAIASCATQPYYAADLKTVSPDDQTSYWVLVNSSVHFSVPDGGGGCARINVIIDSNGRVVDPSIAQGIGNDDFYAWLLKFVSNLRFDPAKTNPARVPIKTSVTWSFLAATTVGDPSSSQLEKQHADTLGCMDLIKQEK